MKVNKTITLDRDIVNKLDKSSNASALIEKLLRDYFENIKPSSQKIDEKKAIMKEKRKEIRQIKAEIKQIAAFSVIENQILKKKELINDNQAAREWFYNSNGFEKRREELINGKYRDIQEFYRDKKGVK